MRVVTEQQLAEALEALPAAEPRAVASGNLATPWRLLHALEQTRERYRLFMLAAQAPLPVRDGVVLETPFVGPGINVLVAAVEQVRARGGLVVAQMNPRMPYTLGDGELEEELINLSIEVDEPLPSPAVAHANDETDRIAELVAELVTDGATLQMGIGQVPDATLRALTGRRELYDRASADPAGDVVPAFGGRHRAGLRAFVRAQRAGADAADH